MLYNTHHPLSVRYSQSEHFVVRFILSYFYHPPSAREEVNKYYSVRDCPAHECFGSVYAVVTAESGINARLCEMHGVRAIGLLFDFHCCLLLVFKKNRRNGQTAYNKSTIWHRFRFCPLRCGGYIILSLYGTIRLTTAFIIAVTGSL